MADIRSDTRRLIQLLALLTTICIACRPAEPPWDRTCDWLAAGSLGCPAGQPGCLDVVCTNKPLHDNADYVDWCAGQASIDGRTLAAPDRLEQLEELCDKPRWGYYWNRFDEWECDWHPGDTGGAPAPDILVSCYVNLEG